MLRAVLFHALCVILLPLNRQLDKPLVERPLVLAKELLGDTECQAVCISPHHHLLLLVRQAYSIGEYFLNLFHHYAIFEVVARRLGQKFAEWDIFCRLCLDDLNRFELLGSFYLHCACPPLVLLT